MSGETKRPYERPTLEAKDVFGAEAVTGTCCKFTNATCSTTARSMAGKANRGSSAS
ncbi:MAG: hypothetical protein HYU41_20430 [Candidatus Rokubacteria bacterium]|nr:hypothetical protein [Candidatus Rokubacteria bacterium]